MSWIIPNWIFPPIFHSLIFAFFFHFSFLLWIWLCLSAFYRCSKYNRFVISVPNFKGRIFVGISGGSNWLLSCHASSWNCQGKQMTYDMWVAAVSYVIMGQKWGGSWVAHRNKNDRQVTIKILLGESWYLHWKLI